MSDSFPIFDIIILFGGLYLLYSLAGMITKNKIPGVLMSKGMELTKEADVPGFIHAMKVPTGVMGVVASISGGLGIACKYVSGIDTLQFVVLIIAFVMLIAYGYIDVVAQKKYLKIG